MSAKIRWGILGVAKIAVEKVIPAMQQGEVSEVTAIASRDAGRAASAAASLAIAKSYGSDEERLADPAERGLTIDVETYKSRRSGTDNGWS